MAAYTLTPSCLISSANAAVGGPIEAIQGQVSIQMDVYNAGSGDGVDHRYVIWGDRRGEIQMATLMISGWSSGAITEANITTNSVLPGYTLSGVTVAISYGGVELFEFEPCMEQSSNVAPVVKAGVVFPTDVRVFKVW